MTWRQFAFYYNLAKVKKKKKKKKKKEKKKGSVKHILLFRKKLQVRSGQVNTDI